MNDEIEGTLLFEDDESEDASLAKLVSGKKPRRNKKAEAEKRAGDRQRANVRLTGFKPLPVHLRGYSVGQAERERGESDMEAMIERMVATSPPETPPVLKRKNSGYVKKRKDAVKRFKAKAKRDRTRYESSVRKVGHAIVVQKRKKK